MNEELEANPVSLDNSNKLYYAQITVKDNGYLVEVRSHSYKDMCSKVFHSLKEALKEVENHLGVKK